MDTAVFSSPDPLNDSVTFEKPPGTRRPSRARYSIPLRSSSPTKQTFELDVGHRLSPQKLLVTVEAGSDGVNPYNYLQRNPLSSPCRATKDVHRERTTTTTIPVKGLSDSEDEVQGVPNTKRGRGRPRKSLGTPVSVKKGRSSTPVPRKSISRRSIGEVVDGDDEGDLDFQIGKDVAIGRGKGRSRSRSTKGVSRKSTPAPKDTDANDALLSTASKKCRGKRKTLVPEEVVVHEDDQSHGSVDEAQGTSVSGALQPINANGLPSTYSTIRSTTTIGWGEPDVLARFDPGNETPQKSGWSSPRAVGEAPPLMLSQPDQSPSPSPETLNLNHQGNGNISILPTSGFDSQSAADLDNLEEGDTYLDEDQLGEMPEFDTILESEGFSMISVDAVPSLRELSSPANTTDEVSRMPFGHRNISTIRRTEIHEDSFSSIPEDALLIATPARTTSTGLLSVPHSHVNDSFSSIPPEVLEAATPARNTQLSKLKSMRPSIDDSFSSVPPDVLEAATPARRLPKHLDPSSQPPRSRIYEDSISALRPAVVDASDSSRPRVTACQPTSMAQAPLALLGPQLSVAPSHPTSRLLTPDKTPSPGKDDEDASKSDDKSEIQRSTTNGSSSTHSQIPSSPPSMAPRRYTYTAHLRRQSQLHPNVTQTPSIVFSSPSLPPPLNVSKAQHTADLQLEQKQNLPISPAARAGQALQSITVPLSPRTRSQSLGSPFKSPISDRKSSPNDARDVYPSPSQERRIRNLPQLDLRDSFSHASFIENERIQSTHQDDPFSNNIVAQRRSPTPEEKEQYNLEMPQQRLALDSQAAALRAVHQSILSEDEMSWQAETGPSVLEDGASTSQQDITKANNVARAIEQEWASERAAVIREIASANPNEVVVIDSDENMSSALSEGDEEIGLLLDTLNSSSPVGPETQEKRKEFVEKPRRSKIPSPWRKNSKRLIYNDEISHLSSPTDKAMQSMPKPFGDANASQPINVYRTERTELQLSDEVHPDLSGWHVPQKSNFNPRPRSGDNLDLSALLASSPAKQLPVLSTRSENQSIRLPVSSGAASVARGIVQPGKRTSEYGSQAAQEIFGSIPQKAGFNPRPIGSSPNKEQTPLRGLFAQLPNSSQSQSHVESLPPKSSESDESLSSANPEVLTRRPSPLADASPSSSLDNFLHSSNTNQKKDINIDSRTLIWTQSLQLSSHQLQTPGPTIVPPSPTKSCLRTPLKPSSEALYTVNASPSKNVQFASSSPIPSPSQEILSPTTWSQAHWLLLNSIWRSHRELQNISPYSYSTSSGESTTESTKRRRNSTRVISKLLGRKVFSQGVEMILEQWHLEVVDEFRGKVPGWEEKVIAMRVFSLIVGEERRKLGLPPPEK